MTTLLLAALLGGCANLPFGTESYLRSDEVSVAMPDDVYRVRDKPAENTLVIASVAASAAPGFDRQQAFRPPSFPVVRPTPQLEAAALQFLRQTGREGCRLVDSYPIAHPQFELRYDCSPRPPLPDFAPRPKRRASKK
jgi:hypothetical protein